MKMRIIASVIFTLILSVGIIESASARGRYYRTRHCYYQGHHRPNVAYEPVIHVSSPHVRVVYRGHGGYHGYNHGYRGRTHHHYAHSYGHHYGYGNHYGRR